MKNDPRVHVDLAHEKLSPVFIPVSSLKAFTYQSASILTRESFETFDEDVLEKLGLEEIGCQHWNCMSDKGKRSKAFKVIKEGYQEGIQVSNFDKFLAVLSHFFGGEVVQQRLLEQKIVASFASLLVKRPFPSEGITSVSQAFYDNRKLLEASSCSDLTISGEVDLSKSFWQRTKPLKRKIQSL